MLTYIPLKKAPPSKTKGNCTHRTIRNTNLTHHPVWSEVLLHKRKFAQLNKKILVLYRS